MAKRHKKIDNQMVNNGGTIDVINKEIKETIGQKIINLVGTTILIAVIIAIIVGFFYLIYLLFNSVVEPRIIQDHLDDALSNGYQYIQYMKNTHSKWATINLFIIATIYLCGLNIFFMRAAIYRGALKTLIISLSILIIPYIITLLISYQSLDKFMAIHINSLYNLVNADKSFKNTPTELKFKKALEDNDYASLKTISNNFNELAKVTPEQLVVIEEIVHVIPITEIKDGFVRFKNGFISYAEYDLFYNKAVEVFNTSEYKDNSELQLLIQKLKITTYDYNQLKIDISKK